MLIVFAITVQAITAKNDKGEFTLCTTCDHYHYSAIDCKEALKDPMQCLDNKQSKTINFKPFDKITASNGINVTIIESDKDFVIAFGDKKTLGGLSAKNKKTNLVFTSKRCERALDDEDEENIIHILVGKTKKNKIIQVQATTACDILFLGEVVADKLTLEATSSSNITIDAKVKILKCTAKSGSVIDIYSTCDSINANSETGGKIEIAGEVNKLGCNATFNSSINVDAKCKSLQAYAFCASKVTATGSTNKLRAEALESSSCDLSELSVKKLYAYAYNMSEINVNYCKNFTTIADIMSIVRIHNVDQENPVFQSVKSGIIKEGIFSSTSGVSTDFTMHY